MTRRPRFDAVVFDLDGTLISHHEPIWKTLHERLGSDRERRRAVVREGLAGRLSYADWFAADLDMLRAAGADRRAIEAIVDELSATPGAIELLRSLKAAGTRLAVLSGAVDVMIDRHLPSGLFDAVHINRIGFDAAGAITGGVATRYDLGAKADGVRALADQFGVDCARLAFVGNGDNDLGAASTAGFAVAWGDAPDALRAVSDVYVEGPNMLDLTAFLL